MSILQTVKTKLSSVGFAAEMGEYPDSVNDPCGKIIYTGEDKPVHFMGGGEIGVETFKIVVRDSSYYILEQTADLIKTALKGAGFIQTGGYEDVEPQEGETFMQLAVNFKKIN